MDRLTRELHDADTRAQSVIRSHEELTRLLDAALNLAAHCYALYENATKRERHMFNQGFFTRLYLAEDGSIDRAELQEPFVQLMARDEDTIVRRIDDRAGVAPQDAFSDEFAATGTDYMGTVPAPLSRGQKNRQERARQATDAVLVSRPK
jgi:hypothetical protein